MTTTETRSSSTAARGTARAPWIASTDHKRLGLVLLIAGLLAVAAAAAAGVVFGAQGADAAHLWTASDERLSSAVSSLAFVVGVPGVWLGLATYVVPLQLGSTRLALPRLHNLAVWTFVSGGVMVAVAHAVDRPALRSLAGSLPSRATSGRSAEAGTELLVVGLGLVALATMLAAVGLVTTILARRGDAVRLANMPVFSWNALAIASVLVVSSALFLSGLVLLYVDQHYGGTLFATRAGRQIWSHQLWLLGRPEALLFATALLGVGSDVVATHARRPLARFGVARAVAVAAPLLTLFVWAGGAGTLQSPYAPVATVGAVVCAVPALLALVVWLDTMRLGSPRAHVSLAFVAGSALLLGLAAVASAAGAIVGVEGRDAQAFRNGQVSLVLLGAPLLAAAAGIAHWSPKLSGRPVPAGAAGLQLLLLLGGAALTAAAGYVVGLGGDEIDALVVAGQALAALAALALVANLVRRGSSEANPYGALTLEWAAPSPPPPHNFDELPDVRSPHPLHDPRQTAGAPS